MIQPLKQSIEKAEARSFMAWHPNFADTSRLPDVKVVRTTFFLNGASIAILGAFLLYFGDKEYSLYQVNSEIVSRESDIKTNKIESTKAVAEYGKYLAEEKTLAEVLNLTKDPFVFSDCVMHLASSLPDRVTLQKIVYRGPGQLFLMSATVQGLDESAGDIASDFVKQLQNDKYLKENFTDVSLTGTVRNTDRSTLSLEISMLSKAPRK